MIKKSTDKSNIYLFISVTFLLLFYLFLIKPQNVFILSLPVETSLFDYINNGYHGLLSFPNNFYKEFFNYIDSDFIAIPDGAFLIGGNDFISSLFVFLFNLLSSGAFTIIKLSFLILSFAFLIICISKQQSEGKKIFVILATLGLAFCIVLFILNQINFSGDAEVFYFLYVLIYYAKLLFAFLALILLTISYIYAFIKLGKKSYTVLIILVSLFVLLPIVITYLTQLLITISYPLIF